MSTAPESAPRTPSISLPASSAGCQPLATSLPAHLQLTFVCSPNVLAALPCPRWHLKAFFSSLITFLPVLAWCH